MDIAAGLIDVVKGIARAVLFCLTDTSSVGVARDDNVNRRTAKFSDGNGRLDPRWRHTARIVGAA